MNKFVENRFFIEQLQVEIWRQHWINTNFEYNPVHRFQNKYIIQDWLQLRTQILKLSFRGFLSVEMQNGMEKLVLHFMIAKERMALRCFVWIS